MKPSTEKLKRKGQIKIVVTNEIMKKGEMEKGIDEKVAKTPCLHMSREVADYHMERVQVLDPRTVDLLHIVFPECLEGGSGLASDQIREFGGGIQHIAGLIDLTLKMNITHPGVPVNWQYPEQLIHPKHACNLGDLCNHMLAILNEEVPE